MKIRFGRLNDKEEYLKTQKEAFPTINSNRDSEFFRLKVKNKEVFIIIEKEEYIGHICFGVHLYEPPFAKSVFVQEMTIKKKIRGKGYGRALMEKLVDFCKKRKILVIYLGTEDYRSNKAIKFYKINGFKKAGYLNNISLDSEYNHGQIFMARLVK